MVFSFRLERGP